MRKLSERFRRFAEEAAQGSSALYAFLSQKISEDDDLLALAAKADDSQPGPNLFLGAVHYLLLKGAEHPLKAFYPSMTESPQKTEEAFSHFKDFCISHKSDITQLLQTKLVQTNEVRRCAYLYPAFCYIYNTVKKPLALIEIGSSSGLQLLWDQYSYTYGTDEVYGNRHSEVHISAEVRGGSAEMPKLTLPVVSFRKGIDLHINDLRDEEDTLWLNALIWPEHQERRDLLNKAAACMRKQPVSLIEGDGVSLLPKLTLEIPKEAVICVFHTHVANQISQEGKATLLEEIKKIGTERDIFHLYNNMEDVSLHLDSFINGNETKRLIGETDGHGRWFTWNLN